MIGYIDNGNQITRDIILQLNDVFKDQGYILQSIADLDELLKQFNDIFDPLKLLGIANGQDEADKESETKEGENGEEKQEKESMAKKLGLDEKSNMKIMQFLGEAVHPHEAAQFNLDDLLDRLGNFFYFKSFKDKDEIDEYVSQPGYGRDEDKPGLCFALGVTQNTVGNKYELELFFNDQWPEVQAGIPLQ